MTCPEALAWLLSTRQFGMKLGLDNIRRLLAELGHPEAGCAFIHVAGTNGKGSVCAFIEAILRAQGFRTGLYTSPHLVSFRERIRVNGLEIAEGDMAAGLSRIREATARWEHSPTFFEITTALAIAHFAQARPDFVVLETGMGGRLDATNAITPRVSIITPIALDHVRWLGGTLGGIAAEKAGIIKPGVPVVSAPQEPEAAEVIAAAAARLGAPLVVVDRPITAYDVALKGGHQRWNAAVAVAAVRAAGIAVSAEAVRRGLATAEWPGRFQRLGRFVLDGAHNPAAARELVATWRTEIGTPAAVVLFGALVDKDYGAILDVLDPIASDYIFVPLDSARAEEPAELRKTAGRGRIAGSAAEAVEMAGALDGPVLVTGSLFLVGDVLTILTRREE